MDKSDCCQVPDFINLLVTFMAVGFILCITSNNLDSDNTMDNQVQFRTVISMRIYIFISEPSHSDRRPFGTQLYV